MDLVKQFEHKGKTVKLYVDPNPTSSAEWDNLGEIVYLKSSRYALGYRGVDREEMDSIRDRKDIIKLPVRAYVHSGAAITADPMRAASYPFNCPWDGGQSGYVYVTLADVRKEYSVKRISRQLRERVARVLISQVETYSQYLQGEVYGYDIFNDKGESLDACWGFYGLEYCEQSAREAC